MTNVAGWVGMVVNPMAGRDIRRLVAHASLVSASEKLMAARRVLAGLAAVPGTRALLVDDLIGYGRALAQERTPGVAVDLVAVEPGAEGAELTIAGVRALARAGAQVVVVLGGDGTQKNAVEAGSEVPLLPVAGGTNNAFCWTGDQTAAGMAAAWVAAGAVQLDQVGRPAKLLHVRTAAGGQGVAVVDVALVRQPATGALAVWNADLVAALAVAVADPTRPGLSNLAGRIKAIHAEDDMGLWVELDRTAPPLSVILAPGLLAQVGVGRHGRLAPGVAWRFPVLGERATLALDGERSLRLAAGEGAEVTLRRDGPPVIDPAQVFARLGQATG